MPEGIRKINVIGHLHPDTDSVCSAIAYAHLKNEVEHTNIYEARRAGAVNRETAFVLKHFGFEEPPLITSVTPQIKDTEIQRQGGIDGEPLLRMGTSCARPRPTPSASRMTTTTSRASLPSRTSPTPTWTSLTRA